MRRRTLLPCEARYYEELLILWNSNWMTRSVDARSSRSGIVSSEDKGGGVTNKVGAERRGYAICSCSFFFFFFLLGRYWQCALGVTSQGSKAKHLWAAGVSRGSWLSVEVFVLGWIFKKCFCCCMTFTIKHHSAACFPEAPSEDKRGVLRDSASWIGLRDYPWMKRTIEGPRAEGRRVPMQCNHFPQLIP